MAEEGADFLDVFHFYREQGYSLEDSYQNASRVFRGSTPDGLPFTKDLSYLKGFILIYNYIQLAVRKGKLEQIPLLFCGKTTLEDMRTLRQLVDEGLVAPPKYLPPQFRDLNALSAWMCFSNFLNPPQPGPHRSGLREHPLTVPRRAGLSRCARAVGRQARRTAMAQPRTRLPHPRRIHADRGDRTRPRETVIAEAGGDELHDRRHPLQPRADGRRAPTAALPGQAVERRQAQARWRVGVHDPTSPTKARASSTWPLPRPIRAAWWRWTWTMSAGACSARRTRSSAQAYGTRVGIAFTKRLGAGFFGGEGFILQKLEAMAWSSSTPAAR
ncbi:membrane protein [Pseudomonas aeruginosa]|nr:membrane protein [Pseudomonas aeruginosa]